MHAVLRKTFALVCLAVLSACTNYSDVDTLGPTVGELSKLPIETASTYISDKTIMTFNGPQTVCPSGYMLGTVYVPVCHEVQGHGTQIEYFSPDGMAFLWYPGNRRAVPARWKLVKGDASYAICFMYPKRSYNPLMKQSGGDWKCVSLGFWAREIVEVRSKDIFSLSTGKLPSRLHRYQTTFDDLLETNK